MIVILQLRDDLDQFPKEMKQKGLREGKERDIEEQREIDGKDRKRGRVRKDDKTDHAAPYTWFAFPPLLFHSDFLFPSRVFIPATNGWTLFVGKCVSKSLLRINSGTAVLACFAPVHRKIWRPIWSALRR